MTDVQIDDACGRGIVLRRIFSEPIAAERESNAFHGHGLCIKVEHIGAIGGVVGYGEAEITALAGGDGLGEGLPIDRGGLKVIFHVSAILERCSRNAAPPAVAVGGEGKLLPLSAVHTIHQHRLSNAALVGDDGTKGYSVQITQTDSAIYVFVEDADGVVGGNLFGDAVECPSCSRRYSQGTPAVWPRYGRGPSRL